MRKQVFGFPTRSDTNWAVQLQKMARGLKFRISEAEGLYYTPNGYTVPAKFGTHFLPCMKNDQKRKQMHLKEVGLTSTEFSKIQIQLRQPPIS